MPVLYLIVNCQFNLTWSEKELGISIFLRQHNIFHTRILNISCWSERTFISVQEDQFGFFGMIFNLKIVCVYLILLQKSEGKFRLIRSIGLVFFCFYLFQFALNIL